MTAINDPVRRYKHAADLTVLHQQAVQRLSEIRALAALELHEGGNSYAAIGRLLSISRPRVQQLIERGRLLRAAGLDAEPGLSPGVRKLSDHARDLFARAQHLYDRGEALYARA